MSSSSAPDEANAVRGNVLAFPPSGRPIGRDDRVAVTHRGETEVYASPAALIAEFRKHDRRHADLVRQAEHTLDRAQAARTRAAVELANARAARRQADHLLATIFWLAGLGAVAALVMVLAR